MEGGGDLRRQFWICARTSYEEELKDQLEKLDGLGPGCVEDLIEYNIDRWCRAYFKTDNMCDICDNNLAETFNGWILQSRKKAVITMLEEIRVMVMKRITNKKEVASTWINNYAPRIMAKLVENMELAHHCHAEGNGDGGYEITEGCDRHTVDLVKRECTCRSWQLSGIPCCHGCLAIMHAGGQPENYLAHWYKKDTYLKAYAHPLKCVRGKKFWPKTNKPQIKPPEFKRLAGRPKKARRRDPDEPKKSGKLSRVGVKIYCSACKKSGHNKATCKSTNKEEHARKRKEFNEGGSGPSTQKKHKQPPPPPPPVQSSQPQTQCSQAPRTHRVIKKTNKANQSPNLQFQPTRREKFGWSSVMTRGQLQRQAEQMVGRRVRRGRPEDTLPATQ